eukprot:gene2329-8623_t
MPWYITGTYSCYDFGSGTVLGGQFTTFTAADSLYNSLIYDKTLTSDFFQLARGMPCEVLMIVQDYGNKPEAWFGCNQVDRMLSNRVTAPQPQPAQSPTPTASPNPSPASWTERPPAAPTQAPQPSLESRVPCGPPAQ